MFLDFTEEEIKNSIIECNGIDIMRLEKNKEARYGFDMLLHCGSLKDPKKLMK